MAKPLLKVKILSRVQEREWRRFFSNRESIWGDCQFFFNQEFRNYDWLVVYDDLPPRDKERFTDNFEKLACAEDNTLLVTTEPSTIKTYGTAFTRQFGHVLTSQTAWALPHPRRIFSQPALRWFYGVSQNNVRSLQKIKSHRPKKSKPLATVCSDKRQIITLHDQRYRFTQALKTRLPELDIYGRGVNPMDDKAESLDDYYYHITIENYMGHHHWTEKLADCFLGLALPFYAGCLNVTEYFPEESFIPINVFSLEETMATIKKTIQDNEYEKRLSAMEEARRLLFEKYHLFAVVSKLIPERHQSGPAQENLLLSRRATIKRSPVTAFNHVLQKTRVRARHTFGPKG